MDQSMRMLAHDDADDDGGSSTTRGDAAGHVGQGNKSPRSNVDRMKGLGLTVAFMGQEVHHEVRF